MGLLGGVSKRKEYDLHYYFSFLLIRKVDVIVRTWAAILDKEVKDIYVRL